MKKKIIFIGTVNFSQIILDSLIANGGFVVGVITSEDKKINSDYCDLSVLCKKSSIDCIKVSDINSSDSKNWIRARNPDIIFCFGWSRLLKEEILQIPPMGVVGFHPASLPRNRGRHPLIWALALGLESTASTFFQMDANADSGEIISQVKVEIKYEDDAASLYAKVAKVARIQVKEILAMLETGNLMKVKQDAEISNTWRKRTQEDGEIDWRMSSRSIYNLVRALTKPYLGAHFSFLDFEYKLWKCKEYAGEVHSNIEPGKLLHAVDGRVVVKCGHGAIELIKTEPHFTHTEAEYL